MPFSWNNGVKIVTQVGEAYFHECIDTLQNKYAICNIDKEQTDNEIWEECTVYVCGVAYPKLGGDPSYDLCVEFVKKVREDLRTGPWQDAFKRAQETGCKTIMCPMNMVLSGTQCVCPDGWIMDIGINTCRTSLPQDCIGLVGGQWSDAYQTCECPMQTINNGVGSCVDAMDYYNCRYPQGAVLDWGQNPPVCAGCPPGKTDIDGVCTHVGPVCGDGFCDKNGGETYATCAEDCPDISYYCGDGTCNNGETCGDCEQDCGTCMSNMEYCGDNTCNNGEDCNSCSQDCGSCSVSEYCGDGSCNNGEDCNSCSQDCGSCSGGGGYDPCPGGWMGYSGCEYPPPSCQEGAHWTGAECACDSGKISEVGNCRDPVPQDCYGAPRGAMWIDYLSTCQCASQYIDNGQGECVYGGSATDYTDQFFVSTIDSSIRFQLGYKGVLFQGVFEQLEACWKTCRSDRGSDRAVYWTIEECNAPSNGVWMNAAKELCVSSYSDDGENLEGCSQIVERVQEQISSTREDTLKKAQEIGCAATSTRWTSRWNQALSFESGYGLVDFTECLNKVDECYQGCSLYGSWTVADCAYGFIECAYNACQYYNSLDGNDYSSCKDKMYRMGENILMTSDAAHLARDIARGNACE